MSRNGLLLAFVGLCSMSACASRGPSSSKTTIDPHDAPLPVDRAEEAGAEVAESIWRAKCGSCHVTVEPGTRARPAIEAALTRHRGRLRLTDRQWSLLVDFLAAPKAH